MTTRSEVVSVSEGYDFHPLDTHTSLIAAGLFNNTASIIAWYGKNLPDLAYNVRMSEDLYFVVPMRSTKLFRD